MLAQVKELARGAERVMVVLDSDHKEAVVAEELEVGTSERCFTCAHTLRRKGRAREFYHLKQRKKGTLKGSPCGSSHTAWHPIPAWGWLKHSYPILENSEQSIVGIGVSSIVAGLRGPGHCRAIPHRRRHPP